MWSRLRQRSSAEGGYTIVELVVTMAIMAIITTAVVSVWVRAQTTTGTVTSRQEDLNTMRTTMNLMTRDIRQAGKVYTDTASSFDADTYINGAKHRVTYTATVASLTRKVDGGSAKPLITNLASTSVFTYDFVGPTLHQVTILLTINSSSKEGTLNLQSDVETRNL